MRTGSRAMKKSLFIGIGTALIVTMGGVGSAQADNGATHTSSAQVAGANVVIANAGASKCASCHRAHTAKAEYLLKQAQPDLCYSCHTNGMGSSLDVQNGVDNGTNEALRGGGFDKARIDAGGATKVMDANGKGGSQVIPALAGTLPSQVTNSKHQIDGVTSGNAWGNGALNTGVGKSLTLECGSCHDPHGNGNYRILRPIPVDSGYAVHVIRPARAAKNEVLNTDGTVKTPAIPAVTELSSPATGIKIPDANAKVYTTANYWLAGDTNVPVDATAAYTGELTSAVAGAGGTAPDGYIANVANWCTTCHTRYLATTQSYKTASGDAQFMYRHRSDANYKAGAANCITCHVSHGSNATMSGAAATQVLLPGDVAGVVGDSKLLRVNNRGTCVMCHNV
jgi:predicted CXXCH cytochrome family protein